MKIRIFTAKTVCFITGALFIFFAVLYNFTSNFTAGTIFCYALGLLLLVYGIFHKKLSEKLPKWLKALFVFAYIFIIVFAISVYICGNSDNVNYEEDILIVLGAGIKGETVGVNLQYRLDAALEYYEKNPDCVIVVSGGRGPYEDITEALAMERYLVSKGIPKEKIIKEENSTSTNENFEFTKNILDNRFGKNKYKAAYITNGYHIYRAGLVAKNAGFEEIAHLHAETPWYTAVPNGLREVIAIFKTWLIG